MSFFDYLAVAYKNNTRNVFKSITFILLIALFTWLLTIAFSVVKTYRNFIEDYGNNNPHNRILIVESTLNEIEEQKARINNQNFDYILRAFHSKHYQTGVDITNIRTQNDEPAHIGLNSGMPNFMPPVLRGNRVTDQNEIICPQELYINFGTGLNNLKNLNAYIGSNFIIEYHRYYIDNTVFPPESTLLATFTQELRLVGTFDNTLFHGAYNVCYVHYTMLETIVNDMNHDQRYMFHHILIEVDRTENIPKVISFLTTLGFNANPFIELHLDDIYLLLTICYIMAALITLITVIVILLFLKKNLKEQAKNITLYRILGFSQKNIYKILLTQLAQLLAIAFLISFIVISTSGMLVQYILDQDILNALLRIQISHYSYLFFFLFIVILVVVSLKNKMQLVGQQSIKTLDRKN